MREEALKRRAAGSVLLILALLMLTLLTLSACAAKPPKPVATSAQLIVSEDVNPDASGRASPIVVRVFQLKTDGEFAAADFFALYDKDKETLGPALLTKEEYTVTPGETRKLDLALDPEARFIAAIAAYRDIRSARWRAITSAPEKKLTDLTGKDGVTVAIGKDAVTLAVKD